MGPLGFCFVFFRTGTVFFTQVWIKVRPKCELLLWFIAHLFSVCSSFFCKGIFVHLIVCFPVSLCQMCRFYMQLYIFYWESLYPWDLTLFLYWHSLYPLYFVTIKTSIFYLPFIFSPGYLRRAVNMLSKYFDKNWQKQCKTNPIIRWTLLKHSTHNTIT